MHLKFTTYMTNVINVIKNLSFLKKILKKLKKEYYSCANIRNGFNFYRNGKISSCCYTVENDLIIGNIEDKDIIKKIEKFQNNLIKLHKKGLVPECCKNCTNFRKNKWNDRINKKLSWIPLNHYKICNLKCVHCGYRKNDDNEKDTNHDLVLNLLKKLHKKRKLRSDCTIAIGGGEPSINKGVEQILQFCLDKKYKALINSNGAKYSKIFADGVNKGLFALDLTPDAGSKEVYLKIKGADFFEIAWDNIKKYVKATDGKANVKFIIEEGNVDDIRNMINKSLEVGIKHVTLAFDLNIQKEDFEKYRKPINKFINLCKENDIRCDVSSFVPREILN